MKIIGIDPGLAIVGYGVIEAEGRQVKLIDYGTVTTPAGMPLPDRLNIIYQGVFQIVSTYKPDAVVITHSHNHITEAPAVFEQELDDLVAAIRGLHGDDVGIIIGGQNPQYAPTANPTQHNTRQADLRRYARVRGFGYVPIFEAFMSQTDPKSFVRSDGVHPTVAGIDLVGTTVQAYLNGLSEKP